MAVVHDAMLHGATAALWSLYSADICTIEGNTGTIAETGTTPRAATTGVSHTCPTVLQTL